jgi:hypothetical protein
VQRYIDIYGVGIGNCVAQLKGYLVLRVSILQMTIGHLKCLNRAKPRISGTFGDQCHLQDENPEDEIALELGYTVTKQII